MHKAIVDNNERPPKSPKVPSWLMSLIQNCWARSTTARPKIVDALAEIEDQLVRDGSPRQTVSKSRREEDTMAIFRNWLELL
jgi:hypothetical protein